METFQVRQIVGIEGNLHNYETAVSLWGHGLISYVYTKLVEEYWLERQWDTSFCMSVWPYLVQDYGRSQATEFLRHTIAHSGQHFFETQLYGDGPGPSFFHSDTDVKEFLESVSGKKKVEPLATIHVHGRNFDRTVWRIS